MKESVCNTKQVIAKNLFNAQTNLQHSLKNAKYAVDNTRHG